ncbi:MAG: PIN domain-containing protein [Anaerolineae bacterium]|nr:PIN domain-containing protein [Anaerolineae bacterium]
MAVLIDTNILLALSFPKDINHSRAREIMRGLKSTRVVSAALLPELFYMVTQRVSYADAIKAFTFLQSSAFKIEPLTTADMTRMQTIMNEYRDAEVDFVDVSIMALAERLNITTVYTLDHRDFSIFRPRHCEFLTLLP